MFITTIFSSLENFEVAFPRRSNGYRMKRLFPASCVSFGVVRASAPIFLVIKIKVGLGFFGHEARKVPYQVPDDNLGSSFYGQMQRRPVSGVLDPGVDVRTDANQEKHCVDISRQNGRVEKVPSLGIELPGKVKQKVTWSKRGRNDCRHGSVTPTWRATFNFNPTGVWEVGLNTKARFLGKAKRLQFVLQMNVSACTNHVSLPYRFDNTNICLKPDWNLCTEREKRTKLVPTLRKHPQNKVWNPNLLCGPRSTWQDSGCSLVRTRRQCHSERSLARAVCHVHVELGVAE